MMTALWNGTWPAIKMFAGNNRVVGMPMPIAKIKLFFIAGTALMLF